MLLSAFHVVFFHMVVINQKYDLSLLDIKIGNMHQGSFSKHDRCKHHQEAMMNWAQFKLSTSSGTSVASVLDNARNQQIIKNRHYLKVLLRALMYCSRQEIGLRGHREG